MPAFNVVGGGRVGKKRRPDLPLVGRDEEIRQALAALDDTAKFQGVVLVGDSGVGKSTLADALADAVGERGQTVRFVLATEAARAVPLGAFSWVRNIGAADGPAMMLIAAQQILEQDDNLIVVVDDAHLLDPLSATLVYRLAVSDRARLIVTIRTGEAVPDAITALWKERLLLRLRLDAFTWEQTSALVRAVLGEPVEIRLVNALQDRTAGNPLMLRSLLRAGRESGVLVRTDDGWQLRGPLHPDRELYDLLEFRLRSFAPAELEAVEVIAAAEVLDWEILRAMCDADAIGNLERHGIIQLVSDESHTVARLFHPILGDVAIQRAGVVRSRQLNGILAQHLRKYLQTDGRWSRSPDVRTRIQAAQFMIRSDLAPDLGLISDAAAQALCMLNIACAEELAQFAYDHGGGFAAAIIFAETMGWQGRGDEAEALLADVAPADGADEELIVRWGCGRAANLLLGCAQVGPTRLVLANVRDRIDSPADTGPLTALDAMVACFSGDIPTAIELGLPLCASDAEPASKAWAALSTCWALALAGRFSEVPPIGDAARRAPEQAGPRQFIIGLAEVVAAATAGDFPAAERICDRHRRMNTAGPEADAFIQAMLGLVHFVRGALPAACAAFNESISVMSQGFPACWLQLVAAWCAQAEYAQQHDQAAAAALRCSEQARVPQLAMFSPELELARAWQRVAVGQMTAARTHALRAAQIAHQSGMDAVVIRAWHTAMRFGDRSCIVRLEELAGRLNTPLTDTIAAHARGLANQDGDLLDGAAVRFTEIGAMSLAADAAAQAAGEHARKGHRGKEVESSTRAHGLASRCGLRTPAVEATAHPLPIKGREREVAMLVAAGLSNREIAHRLFLSVRTTEGHLYRIFGKLGINHRDQLIHLLDLERPAS